MSTAPFRASELITYTHPSDGRSYVIQPTGDGDLRCASCDKDWCPHIQTCMMANLDAAQVWMRIERFDPTGQGAEAIFTVPLRPSDDIRAMVAVARLPHNPDAAKVTWWTAVGPHSIPLIPFMGFLNRGEGRLHLRQMMVNWFEPMLELDQHSCGSIHHNWRVDGRLAADKDDRTKLFVHCWRMVFSGMCNYCYQQPTQFDPDLLPGA